MQHLVNKEVDKWIRIWDKEKFNNISDRDERFFSLVIKGVLEWLNTHIRMYGKPIKHFIFNTGSSYMYLENNGYEYTWCEASGEDFVYMETPRSIVKIGSFSINTDELTNPYSTGVFERESSAPETDGQIIAFNAQVQRMPVEIEVQLKYVFSNFNESIIFIQELFEKIVFQKYFNIIYLGEVIQNSLELDGNTEINFSDIDLSSNEPNRRTIDVSLKVCTNLPIINEKTVCKNNLFMSNGVASPNITLNNVRPNKTIYGDNTEKPSKDVVSGIFSGDEYLDTYKTGEYDSNYRLNIKYTVYYNGLLASGISIKNRETGVTNIIDNNGIITLNVKEGDTLEIFGYLKLSNNIIKVNQIYVISEINSSDVYTGGVINIFQ